MLWFLAFMFFGALARSSPIENGVVLGSKACTVGPSYWCAHIRNARECNALHHCIDAVWTKQKLPVDDDDVCTICKNMVQEARDTLLSNETQEELKEVFEGSCRLIPLKIVADECVKLADEFIPELVETLSSEMNPQMVCAAAGLCNSERIDKLLAGSTSENTQVELEVSCKTCKKYFTPIMERIHEASDQDIRQHLLMACGYLGSQSDGCVMLVQQYSDSLVKLVKEMDISTLCLYLGTCNPTGTVPSKVPGMSELEESPVRSLVSVPREPSEECQFCLAVFTHWRDMIVSNTSAQEFRLVLEGLCKQTGTFSKECLSLVDKYSVPFYDWMSHQFNPKKICRAIYLCPSVSIQQANIWTLLPSQKIILATPLETPMHIIGTDEAAAFKLDEEKKIPATPLESPMHIIGTDEAAAFKLNEKEIPATPLESPMHIIGTDEAAAAKLEEEKKDEVSHLHRVSLKKDPTIVSQVHLNSEASGEECIMCQYLLHELQNYLSEEPTKEEIEKAVGQVCSVLPSYVRAECHNFIQTYGDLIIALLVQNIDPSVLCKQLNLCPKEILLTSTIEPDLRCQACEFVLYAIRNYLSQNSTEEEIHDALVQVCDKHIPAELKTACKTLVDDYEAEIVDGLIMDLNPEEICRFIRLCKKKSTQEPEFESNEIPPLPLDAAKAQLPLERIFIPENHGIGLSITPKGESGNLNSGQKVGSAQCVICEFVMQELEQLLKDNATDHQIEEALRQVCSLLPKTVRGECNAFVEQYYESLIQLLESLAPEEVCSMLQLCMSSGETMQVPIQDLKLDKCDGCRMVIDYLDRLLENEDVEKYVVDDLVKVCHIMPASYSLQCEELIDTFGPYLLDLLGELNDSMKVCRAIDVCPKESGLLQLYGGPRCFWGSTYWCQSLLHAKSCNKLDFCKNLWAEQGKI